MIVAGSEHHIADVTWPVWMSHIPAVAKIGFLLGSM